MFIVVFSLSLRVDDLAAEVLLEGADDGVVRAVGRALSCALSPSPPE